MSRLILFVIFVIGLVILSRHLRTLQPEDRKRFYWRLFVFSLVIGVFLLALSGRLHFIAAIVAAILPFIKNLWPLIRYVPLLRRLYQQNQAAKQPESGSASQVETSLLNMTLDHDSGDLDGEVLEGPYQGKRLSELSLSELIHIHKVVQTDYHDSLAVLEAYLDRMHGDEWREQATFQESENEAPGNNSGNNAGEMSLSDAYAILGLQDSASKDEVLQAHRKLMQKLHPDRGGSDFLAAQVNLAKDLILKSKEQD